MEKEDKPKVYKCDTCDGYHEAYHPCEVLQKKIDLDLFKSQAKVCLKHGFNKKYLKDLVYDAE